MEGSRKKGKEKKEGRERRTGKYLRVLSKPLDPAMPEKLVDPKDFAGESRNPFFGLKPV